MHTSIQRSWRATVLTFLIAILAIAAPAVSAQSTPVTTATDSIVIEGLAESPVTVSIADLQTYAAETVEVTYEAGGEPQTHTFTGTSLYGVLDGIGFGFPEDARNPLLTVYIVINAYDGYQVVLSGGDLDPNFGNAPILLAWEVDGGPIEGEDGPIRLVVPGDLRGGRYVSGITSIEVVNIAGEGDEATPEHGH